MVQIYFHLVDPCQYMYHINMPVLSVDAIAMSGKHEVDLHTNIWMQLPCLGNMKLICHVSKGASIA